MIYKLYDVCAKSTTAEDKFHFTRIINLNDMHTYMTLDHCTFVSQTTEFKLDYE